MTRATPPTETTDYTSAPKKHTIHCSNSIAQIQPQYYHNDYNAIIIRAPDKYCLFDSSQRRHAPLSSVQFSSVQFKTISMRSEKPIIYAFHPVSLTLHQFCLANISWSSEELETLLTCTAQSQGHHITPLIAWRREAWEEEWSNSVFYAQPTITVISRRKQVGVSK